MRVQLQNHGSVWLAQPLDIEARQLLEQRADGEAQWWGHALVVEPRYVAGLRIALEEDGAEVDGV